MDRVRHSNGHFDFLTGIPAFSSGVRAHDGYEIVRCVFGRPVSWEEGFDRAARGLDRDDVDPPGLCSVELRCAEPYSADAFDAFNEHYVARLLSMGVFGENESNPVARTNVAPVDDPPREQSMFAFSYVRPATTGEETSFVIAGGGEVKGSRISEETIVRFGETTDDAMGEKAAFVLDVMEKRLTGLGLSWGDARSINVYTRHSTNGAVARALHDRTRAASIHGLHLYRTDPPVTGIAFEMDVKGPTWELWLP